LDDSCCLQAPGADGSRIKYNGIHIMKLSMKFIYSVFLIFLLFYLASCNDNPTESKTGIISVSIIDNDTEETPLADVEITITPGDIVKETDTNGLCIFDVDPGDYYVNADVCCVGPGFIEYHEPVTVVENETTKVKLLACLSCV